MTSNMDINVFFDQIEEEVRLKEPRLLRLYKNVRGEALFAYSLYKDSFDKTQSPPSKIMEVGGGVMLLSCYLSSINKNVVSIEPTGQGFSEFENLRKIVLSASPKKPEIIEMGVEDISIESEFDFAYSINVMEHVDSVSNALTAIEKALKPGAEYRFICPNYHFPYEPHFNIPTVITKKWTHALFKKKIYNHPMNDPKGVWKSLNWITVSLIKKRYKKKKGFSLSFNRDIFAETFLRVKRDKEFSERRSSLIIHCVNFILKTGLHKLFKYVPLIFVPVMDCRILKSNP